MTDANRLAKIKGIIVDTEIAMKSDSYIFPSAVVLLKQRAYEDIKKVLVVRKSLKKDKV